MRRIFAWFVVASALCSTTTAADKGPIENGEAEVATETQRLLEGDDIRITFPGAPSLDTVQKIRSDGMISMPHVGEVRAAGLTPVELQNTLADLYKGELVSNEVLVSVVASTYPVYVTGAVMGGGEVRCDRPTTVLEAIMKAGGFDPIRARLDRVMLIRRGEKMREVNLKAVLEGKAEDDVFVKASDKIIVPHKTFSL